MSLAASTSRQLLRRSATMRFAVPRRFESTKAAEAVKKTAEATKSAATEAASTAKSAATSAASSATKSTASDAAAKITQKVDTKSATDAAKAATEAAAKKAQEMQAKAQELLKKAPELQAKAAELQGKATATFSKAMDATKGMTEQLSKKGGAAGKAAGYVDKGLPLVIYYAKVGAELAKLVFNGRQMSPPSIATFQSYGETALARLRNPSELAKQGQQLVQQAKGLSNAQLAAIGVVFAECVGFFTVGEMIGRFKIVGYRGGNAAAHH